MNDEIHTEYNLQAEGFWWADGFEVFMARPQMLFKPKGLIIWGAPNGAYVEQALIDQNLQIVVAYGGVPCKFFAFGESYAQIAEKLDQGIEPPGWCDWSAVKPGQSVQIRICIDTSKTSLGKPDGIELVMWGLTEE